MRQYDFRELKINLSFTLAEKLKAKAKAIGITEAELVKRAITVATDERQDEA